LGGIHSHSSRIRRGPHTPGGDNSTLNKIKRFRLWVVEGDTKRDIKNAPEKVRHEIGWELKKIKGQVATLLKVVG
jgi:hypothetical protein